MTPGLDKLLQDLEDAKRAFQSIDGTIAALTIDATSQASIDAAIRQMERVIDSKASHYRGNALVDVVVKGLKDQYRKSIRERAKKVRQETAVSA